MPTQHRVLVTVTCSTPKCGATSEEETVFTSAEDLSAVQALSRARERAHRCRVCGGTATLQSRDRKKR